MLDLSKFLIYEFSKDITKVWNSQSTVSHDKNRHQLFTLEEVKVCENR